MCTPAGPGTVKELRADLCGAVLWRRYVGVDDTPRKLRLHGRVGAGGVRGLSRRSVHGQPQAEGRRLFARGVFGSVSDAETRFRLLAEAIPQIVWTAVPGGGIDYCNQRFYDLTGFSKEETLGWAWQQALHPEI